MVFARHQFELAKPQKDGLTLHVHLNAVWEKSGEMPAMLANAPPLPDGLSSLWSAFGELHSSRGSTGFGLARITFSDMVHWQMMSGRTLQPWQVDMIRKADDLWLVEFHPKPKGEE